MLGVFAGPASSLNTFCLSQLSIKGRVVTPIDAVLTAKTGDTMRSPGHGGFFLSVTGSLRFFEASRDPLEGGVIA